MNHVILERDFEQPIVLDDVWQMAEQSMSCMQIYGVEWQSSHLARDGSRLYCHFQAPDTEALRNVMRVLNSEYKSVWPGELRHGESDGEPGILVERSWPEPVNFEDIARVEQDHAWCLEAHDVTFQRSFFSLDRRRMLCLYQAPDAESVRQSQSKAGMPFDAVWSFLHITPALWMAQQG